MLIAYCLVGFVGAFLNAVLFWHSNPLLGLALTPFAASASVMLAAAFVTRIPCSLLGGRSSAALWSNAESGHSEFAGS